MILDVILGRSISSSSFICLIKIKREGVIMNLQENRPNKMAKEMNSKQHRFQGFLEISHLSYLHIATAKEKRQGENNEITCARD